LKTRPFAGVAALLITFFIGTIVVKKDVAHYALRNFSQLEYKIRNQITRKRRRPIDPPLGWRKIEAEGLFTVYLPSDFEQLDGAAGLDNFYSIYSNGNITLNISGVPCYEYDRRREVLGEDFREQPVIIAGFPATAFSYTRTDNDANQTYVSELYVGDWSRGAVTLDMEISAKTPDDLRIAEQVFRTIDMP